MGEDYLYRDVDNAYVCYIIELIFKSISELEYLINDRCFNKNKLITNNNDKYFDRIKLILLFIEVINLLRIDDKLFNIIIDRIRDTYQHEHSSKGGDFFLDRFIECRNFLRFRLKNDKNINLIDLDENDKK